LVFDEVRFFKGLIVRTNPPTWMCNIFS